MCCILYAVHERMEQLIDAAGSQMILFLLSCLFSFPCLEDPITHSHLLMSNWISVSWYECICTITSYWYIYCTKAFAKLNLRNNEFQVLFYSASFDAVNGNAANNVIFWDQPIQYMHQRFLKILLWRLGGICSTISQKPDWQSQVTSIKLLARLDGLKRVNSSRSPPPPLRAPSPSHHSNGIQTLVKHPSGTYRLVQAGKRPRPCAIQCIACITLTLLVFVCFCYSLSVLLLLLPNRALPPAPPPCLMASLLPLKRTPTLVLQLLACGLMPAHDWNLPKLTVSPTFWVVLPSM